MSKQKVLVVDDEPIVCQSVEKVLRRKGFEIEQTLMVSAALEILESGKQFDLIIAPIVGKALGKGFNIVFLAELPTTKRFWDITGPLYQFGISKSF